MSRIAELFWGTLIVGGITFVAVAGALLVRRWAPVEVLERHNEVAGFIYSVIGVMYAVPRLLRTCSDSVLKGR